MIVKLDRPIKDLEFSGFKEIYQYSVENKEIEFEDIKKSEPEPEPDSVKIAEEELNEKLQQAHEQGFTEGYNKKDEEFSGECQNEINLLRNIATEVNNLKNKFLNNGDEVILKLAFKIAGLVIKNEINTNPEIIQNILKKVLAKISSIENNIIVKINPSDKENLVKNITNIAPHLQEVDIQADENITRGGCFVETDFSTINATVESQLNEIEHVLLQEFNND